MADHGSRTRSTRSLPDVDVPRPEVEDQRFALRIRQEQLVRARGLGIEEDPRFAGEAHALDERPARVPEQ